MGKGGIRHVAAGRLILALGLVGIPALSKAADRPEAPASPEADSLPATGVPAAQQPAPGEVAGQPGPPPTGPQEPPPAGPPSAPAQAPPPQPAGPPPVNGYPN